MQVFTIRRTLALGRTRTSENAIEFFEALLLCLQFGGLGKLSFFGPAKAVSGAFLTLALCC